MARLAVEYLLALALHPEVLKDLHEAVPVRSLSGTPSGISWSRS